MGCALIAVGNASTRNRRPLARCGNEKETIMSKTMTLSEARKVWNDRLRTAIAARDEELFAINNSDIFMVRPDLMRLIGDAIHKKWQPDIDRYAAITDALMEIES
jgi:hypothetical protein